VKEVMRDVLSKSADEPSRWNGGGDGVGGPYRDTPEMDVGLLKFSVAGEMHQDRGLDNFSVCTAPRLLPNPRRAASKTKEKEKVDVKQAKGGWRSRWKRVLSVPAFKSPLMELLSPVVTRVQ